MLSSRASRGGVRRCREASEWRSPKMPQKILIAPLAAYRAELRAWLAANHERLAPRYDPPGTLDDHIAQMQRVKSILFEAGWMQFGWPERVGGRGGSPMLRTELGASIAARDLVGSGAVLADRGARAHADRLRAAGARRRGRAPPALGRRALVPGLLRAGRGKRPRVAPLPRRARGRPAHRVDVGDRRPEGLDQPRAVRRPLRAPHANRAGAIRGTAASPRSSSTWTRRESRSGRSR